MEPWFWRVGAAVSALGACAIAPSLASGLILFSLGLPMSAFAPGLWHDYWQVLDQPAYRPYATRIAICAGAGLVLPLLLWCLGIVFWRRRAPSVPVSGPFDRLSASSLLLTAIKPGVIHVTKERGRTLGAPDAASVLVSAPYYPEAHAVVLASLRHADGSTLVIDCGSRSLAFAHAAPGRTVLRLSPFGGGPAWNPLAGAWGPQGLSADELRHLAAGWFPEANRHERFIVSHTRNAFVSLAHVVADVLRSAHNDAPPAAPGDIHRLCAQAVHYVSRRAFLQTLAERPEVGFQARGGLRGWLGLDDAGIDIVWKRVSDVLAPFADPIVDAATRSERLAPASWRRATVYLDVPDRWRTASGPFIESAIRQWQAALDEGESSLLLAHALDTLPPIAALTDAESAWRCLATTRGLAALHDRYGNNAIMLDRRFTACVVHAPRDEALARRESDALKQFVAAHRDDGHLASTPASPTGLMSLRVGEQIVVTPSVPTPVICRTLTSSRKPNTPPPQTIDQGEAMPVSKSLIAFFSALAAGAPNAESISGTSAPPPVSTAASPAAHVPLVEAKIGKHRFMFPKNMYYQQVGPDRDGGVMLIVRWPTLQPYPPGVDYHHDNLDFISHISIDISEPNLSDAEYRTLLRRYIEPLNPDDKAARADPSRNLDLRIKGEPRFGLIPYFADFDKLKPYFDNLYKPGSPASRPEHNDDWFVRWGTDGVPTTVIICSSRLIPDGASIQSGVIVDGTDARRSSCQHSFLVPELRLVVHVTYLRVIVYDWQRIESEVRTMLETRRVK
ncbi:MAG: hypothetical protein AAGC76_09820 [Luteibacter sp.]|uniref:hypothetical protein n=1 Tax=Luteibacter sp. TaxID=1886636 RepID=UPI0028076870|nr:hypothetical protein [Luteibacter sp.]MDQ7996137.1 hypothetical protein [Luteibacter sp.]